MENAIVLIGNTGEGKSFISNQIFKLTESNESFESGSGLTSLTQKLQNGRIDYNGKTFTLLDTPGFFDCSKEEEVSAKKDGENLCKLVNALENAKSIAAIVYVFCGRLSTAQKLWYDKIITCLTPAYKSQIIFLHNKQIQTYEQYIKNKIDLEALVKAESGTVGYHHLNTIGALGGAEEIALLWDQLRNLLNDISQRVSFTLNNLIVPEVCYEREEIGRIYEKELTKFLTDVGHTTINRRDGSYYNEIWVRHPDRLQRLLGRKVLLRVFVERMVDENIHVKKEVTTQIIGVYQDVYRVRFDGTRDLKEIRLLETKHVKYGC